MECSETDNQGIKCSKCSLGYELKQSKCLQKSKKQNIDDDQEGKRASPNIQIIQSIFKNSPPRVELTFDDIIYPQLNKSNINIAILSKNQEKTTNQISVRIERILSEKNSNQLKIYLQIKGLIQEGVLTIQFRKGSLSSQLKGTNTTKESSPQKIEIEGVQYYQPNYEIEIIEGSSKVISYGVAILLMITLLDSASSIFDFIKFGQMIGFIALLNFEHPTNLKALFDFLRMNFLDFGHKFSKERQNDVCVVDKDKFVDEEFTCYILEGQGKYIVATFGLWLFYLLLKFLNYLKRCSYLEDRIIANMKMKFWNRYFEVIRLDIFISICLKASLVIRRKNDKDAWVTANILASTCLGLFYLSLMVYQFYKIHKVYTSQNQNNPQKRPNLNFLRDRARSNEAQSSINFSARAGRNPITSQRSLFMMNSRRNKIQKRLKRKKGLAKVSLKINYCSFCDDKKSEFFYQKNHLPLLTLKEILISMALVVFYNQPKTQISLVWLALAVYLGFDFYFKPDKEEVINKKELRESAIYVLITGLAFMMVSLDGHVSEKINYYFFGYLMMILILYLLYHQLKHLIWIILQIFGRFHQYLNKNKKKRVKRRKRLNLTRRSPVIDNLETENQTIRKETITTERRGMRRNWGQRLCDQQRKVRLRDERKKRIRRKKMRKKRVQKKQSNENNQQ